MARRLVSIDRETPMLMPPTIQEWVGRDDMARFVVDAVGAVSQEQCRYNWRGSGDEQYPPHMMLALLIYCYANGTFSSRKIERATYRDVAVRYITGDTHPDHDTIATFRRENGQLFQACFVRVLEVAKVLKIKCVGEVAIDGSIVEANASKTRVLSREQMRKQEVELEQQVEELLERARRAEVREAQAEDGHRLPDELVQVEKRREAMKRALETLGKKTAHRAAQRQQERQDFDRSGPGSPPRALEVEVQDADTLNLTDPDARLLPQKKGGYASSYNVQAAVQAASNAPLILATAVCDQSNDRRQLEPMIERTLAWHPDTKRVLVDSGYDNSAQIYKMEQRHRVVIYCPPEEKCDEGRKSLRRSEARERTEAYRQGMRACMKSSFGRQSQRLRSTTVEPVFGWIKKTLGFQRFHLRGLAKVNLEWNLVCLAFNFQLINRLTRIQKMA